MELVKEAFKLQRVSSGVKIQVNCKVANDEGTFVKNQRTRLHESFHHKPLPI